MSYTELHRAAEEFILKKLRARGHEAERQVARDRDVIFDVYDATTDTAWEVQTAKIVRSSHEQDEAIITKIFRYLLFCQDVKFIIASFDHDELELFHRLGLEHWHLHDSWWRLERLRGWIYHRGKTARQVAMLIFSEMTQFAPLSEWVREGRRADHPKARVAKAFETMTDKLGLPKNFLVGMWRDWRLMWVWKLEQILPEWARRFAPNRSIK
jgi:hypothetical protein